MTIDLIIVTGYLGSGKTTLLRDLKNFLPRQRCHFIVNEAGQVALDQAAYELVEDTATVVEGGCACCVRKDALIDSLRSVVNAPERWEFNDEKAYIVVETSGLANPAPIIFSIKTDPYLSHHLSIAGVVCVLGSVEGFDALTRYSEVGQQLAMADVVILSKIDRVNYAQLQKLENRVATIAIHSPIFYARNGLARWEKIFFALQNYKCADKQDVAADWLQSGRDTAAAVNRHAGFSSCVLRFEPSLDWIAFGLWLSALLATHGESIVRVKGVIRVSDWNSQRFFVLINGVQHVMYPPQHIATHDDLPEVSSLVFILKNIEPEQIAHSLHKFHTRHVGEQSIRIWQE